MKIIFLKSFKIFALVLALLTIVGCSSRTNNVSSPNKNNINKKKEIKKKPPEEFHIRIKIENGEIALANLLYDVEDELGTIKADGIYFYLDDPILKLDSNKFANYYWTVKLPIVPHGDFKLKAYIQEKNIHFEKVEAPLSFFIVLEAKNKKIVDHYIEDSKYYWGRFRFYKIDSERNIVYFINHTYPGYLWATSYQGVVTGKYKLSVKLLEEKYYEN